MPIAECPECRFHGPHVPGVHSANLTCARCHVTFANPAVVELRAQSFAAWSVLLGELNRIIDAPYRRRAMRTEYRRRTKARSRR